MRYNYVKYLQCSKCGKIYEANRLHQLCECGKPLLVRYDLERMKREVDRNSIKGRVDSLWRYRELLPVVDDDNIVSMGEGMTPLIHCQCMGEKIGIRNLCMKDEGLIPTGTFKARGAAVGVSMAKELKVSTLAMPTNGNAGAAWALYSSKACIGSFIVMPEDAPAITRSECAASGAELYLIKGLISDAGKVVASVVARNGWYDVSTLKEPYRIEGKKTMGIEICEQLGWKVPDVIIYPTGGGVGLIGIYKALQELQELGWIERKMPRLVAAQAVGCSPIVEAWRSGFSESKFFENSRTIAFGINVPKALGDFIVLEAIYATSGCAIAIEDEEIMKARNMLASNEGEFICPEGAAAFSAAAKLRESGWIKPEETVVVLNTGAGIKYPDAGSLNIPYIDLDGNIQY